MAQSQRVSFNPGYKKPSFFKLVAQNKTLLLMCLPAVVFFFIFSYMPMPGAYIAFTNFQYNKGIWASPFVGLQNFKFLFTSGQLTLLLRNTILYNVAFIESALDDPEHYSLDGFPQKLEIIVDNLVDSVDNLLTTFDNGKVLSEGINTVIVGKPNAGKSSLMNMFVGEERAIVTDMAGTTRDTLSEVINVRGITLNIVDTAGIRDTDDVVEKIGVDKALESVDKADLVLYVVDSSIDLDENDHRIMSRIQDKNVVVILNKSDLEKKIDESNIKKYIDADIIQLSALTGDGSEELYELLNRMFFEGTLTYNDQLYITNTRHKNELVCTKNALLKVKESIDMGMEEDFFSIDLMDAYEHLGLIIGETARDDLADKIFKEFCMGK